MGDELRDGDSQDDLLRRLVDPRFLDGYSMLETARRAGVERAASAAVAGSRKERANRRRSVSRTRKAAPEAEPETVAAPEAEPETVAAPGAEPETVAAPGAEPETVAAPGAEPEAVAAPGAEPEAVAAPGAEPEAVAAPEAVRRRTPRAAPTRDKRLPLRRDRRDEIVDQLQAGPASAQDLADRFGISREGVLRWLRMLEADGVIASTASSRTSRNNRWVLAAPEPDAGGGGD
ncbi:MAG TPA: HTH domain-containing protein [Acidimicrobiales bacterium]|nr:HTH domain-containing protein [Acidimicrobiales bacterium]